ncbi:glutathione S-transferase family protein [Roseobacteraceae bacterium S113]
MLQFFYAPNTISVATAIALHEAGLAYEARPVSFADGDQKKPEYLAINPKARVPALVTEQGVLTETGALLDYVAALAPQTGLMPADPYAAAQVRSLIHYLASTMHVNHAHRMRGSRWAKEESSFADMRAMVPETMTASTQFMEDHIQGPLLFGEAITAADCHYFTICTWLEGDGVDNSAFPKTMAFMDAMRARPSVQAVMAAGILT